jgi:hypothetical protein
MKTPWGLRTLHFLVAEWWWNARWSRCHTPTTLTDWTIRNRLEAIRKGEA